MVERWEGQLPDSSLKVITDLLLHTLGELEAERDKETDMESKRKGCDKANPSLDGSLIINVVVKSLMTLYGAKLVD
eukprot:CAMPEP_0116902762 /NCGR_PEP_ID=MMETSP0467-20121206/10264_1 /TAXON_ID=283647 /ORGANISM="Mesodinium pulex, Strain SPMC105" /LENGTH=75 /DNA_ID=CAMNT_0004576773 /DNA_START=941 /DNA_END=1168 /DNA_ORIENTATION=+